MSEEGRINVFLPRDLIDAGCRVVRHDDGSIHIELDGQSTPTPAPQRRRLLIPEWRRAWRLSTVWAAALLGALSMVQAEVLPQLQALVPPQRWPWVTAGFALAIVLLRIVAQPKALDPNTGDRP